MRWCVCNVWGLPEPQSKHCVTFWYIFKVCANDAGGSEAFNMKWSSLLKLRLQCSTDVENYRSDFNLVTDMVKGSGDLVYGTFMTLVSCYYSDSRTSIDISMVSVFSRTLNRNRVRFVRSDWPIFKLHLTVISYRALSATNQLLQWVMPKSCYNCDNIAVQKYICQPRKCMW